MSDNGSNDVIETNVDYFVTVTTIKRSVSIEELITTLRLRKTNGDLCFHFNNGGIRRIELTERTGLQNGEADEVRKILDMD